MNMLPIFAAFVFFSSQLFLSGWSCNIVERGFDENTQALILDLHNKARQKVANGDQNGQPSASNMKELHWDNEIAKLAQRAAERCDTEHTPEEDLFTSKYEYVGENLYGGSKPNPLQRAVDDWYSEVKDVDPSILGSFNEGDRTIGHYTQMVWAETEALGCGYSKTAEGYSYVYCEYGPGGNYEDEVVYNKGNPASECESGASKDYPALCK
uniref:Cysteine-rich venom protein n=1 Tax=Hemiscolopendra marginata TaxID=943146 RepID=A0A646QGS6_9MYRI